MGYSLGYSAKEMEKMDEKAFEQIEKRIKQEREAEESDGFEQDNLLKAEKDTYYYLMESSTTFDLSDVIGFVYGGFCSRFWIYRKHINSFNFKTEHPFFAW